MNPFLRDISDLSPRDVSYRLKKPSKPRKEAIYDFKDNSLGHIIQTDDFNSLMGHCLLQSGDLDEDLEVDDIPIRNLLDLSAATGSLQCFKYLLKNFNHIVTDDTVKLSIIGGNCDIVDICETLLGSLGKFIDVAVRFRQNDIVTYILENYDDFTPINPFDCCEYGNIECLLFCLSRGHDINERNSLKKSLLHVAVENSHYDVAEMLIKLGADIYAVDCVGSTPFVYAISVGNFELCDLFLRNGYDINSVDGAGLSPLHYASRLRSLSFVDFLLKNGANVNINDFYQNITPLHFAVLNLDSDLCLKLIHNSADTNVQTKHGKTPLYMATERGSESVCKILLDHGAEMYEKIISYLAAHISRLGQLCCFFISYFCKSGICNSQLLGDLTEGQQLLKSIENGEYYGYLINLMFRQSFIQRDVSGIFRRRVGFLIFDVWRRYHNHQHHNFCDP